MASAGRPGRDIMSHRTEGRARGEPGPVGVIAGSLAAMAGADEAGQAELARIQHEVAEMALPDPILRVLISVCNRGTLTFALTVAQGGLIISGTAVGVGRYMANVAAELEERDPDDAEVLAEPLRFLAGIAAEPPADRASPVQDLPIYLHLEQARIRSGDAIVADGVRWRGRLEAVDGWSLGLHA